MSTESTTKPAAPLACSRCRDEDGPFTKDGLCEECEPEVASALRGASEAELADGLARGANR